METCAGPVSSRASGARLLPLCPVPPSGRQSPLWHSGAGLRVGRSDHAPTLLGQSGLGPERLAPDAVAVRRSRQSDCQLRGLTQRAPGPHNVAKTPSRGLSTGQWRDRVVEQVYVSRATQALRGLVV